MQDSEYKTPKCIGTSPVKGLLRGGCDANGNDSFQHSLEDLFDEFTSCITSELRNRRSA